MKMTKWVQVLGVAALVLTVAGVSAAGWLYTTAVLTSTSSRSLGAKGAVAVANASSDSAQNISCWTAASSTGTGYGYCHAMDSSGRSRICNTTDPHQIAVMQSVGPASLISFSVLTSGTLCQDVTVANGSPYARY
jgi:hypothetical protein